MSIAQTCQKCGTVFYSSHEYCIFANVEIFFPVTEHDVKRFRKNYEPSETVEFTDKEIASAIKDMFECSSDDMAVKFEDFDEVFDRLQELHTHKKNKEKN